MCVTALTPKCAVRSFDPRFGTATRLPRVIAAFLRGSPLPAELTYSAEVCCSYSSDVSSFEQSNA
jgi:hypothetical protein